jgi:UDP-glucose 6-dehydrogenase
LICGLQKKGYTSIVAYDPQALVTFQKYYPDLNVIYVKTSSEVLEQAKTIVIATAWDEFRFLDYTDKNLIDGRYMIKER